MIPFWWDLMGGWSSQRAWSSCMFKQDLRWLKFYCGGCLFTLYCYPSKTMAPCHGDCVFDFSFEGEVPLGGASRGVNWKSSYGKAMPSRRYQTSIWGGSLDYPRGDLVAFSRSNWTPIYWGWWSNVWKTWEGYCRHWCKEVLSSWGLIASSKKRGVIVFP